MDGDAAPLAELADVCRRRDALFIVDEAHSAGRARTHGRGRRWADALGRVRLAARVIPAGRRSAEGGVAAGPRAARAARSAARARSIHDGAPPRGRGALLGRRGHAREPERRGAVVAWRRFATLHRDLRTGGGALVPWLAGSREVALPLAER